jgi:hypothetical protein
VTFPGITTITDGCFRERRSGRWNDHNGAKQTAQSVPSFVLEWWKIGAPDGIRTSKFLASDAWIDDRYLRIAVVQMESS